MSLAFRLLLCFEVAIGPVFWALSGFSSQNLPSLLASAVVLFAWIFQSKRPKSRYRLVLLVLLLLPNVGIHYASAGVVINYLDLPLINTTVENIDRFMWGSLFPDGQVALFFEQNAFFSPHAFTGRIISDFAILFYVSYYFWGFIFIFYLLRIWVKTHSGADRRDLLRFVCAFKGGFLLSFCCYLFFPLVSPDDFGSAQYAGTIEGFGLSGGIIRFLDANRSTPQDCFPSGHVGLSWIMAIGAYRLRPPFGKWLIFVACMITFATVYFRFHYMLDIFAAVPLIFVGLAWGEFLTPKKERRCLKKQINDKVSFIALDSRL